MADTSFDIIIIGSGPGGYVSGYQGRAAWALRRLRSRAPVSRWNLPELGLHPDQGAAQEPGRVFQGFQSTPRTSASPSAKSATIPPRW